MINTNTTKTSLEREIFAQGRIEIPGPLKGDAYTVAGEAIADPKSKQKSTYGIMFRRSPKDAPEFKNLAKDDRMILYGVTDYIRNQLTKPVTSIQIDQAEEFMKTAHAFGGELAFDRRPWDRVVSEYNGYLPIKIDALPEGSTFYKNEVPVQVSSLDEGFGEIAALVESDLLGMVAHGSTRATMERHMLERLIGYAKEDMPNSSLEEQIFAAQLMIHDFSKRASSVPEESEYLGKAHLLSFPGTDNFDAAFAAYSENNNERVGSSVLALAHRIVMGHDSEQACFDNLRAIAGEGGLASYLADTYNFKDAVENKLTPMAKRASETDGAIIVGRPDSGYYLENSMKIINTGKENGLYTTQDNGRIAMTNLKYISGDSMNWNKVTNTLDTQIENNFSSMNCGIFGLGGNLRNTPTRDTLSVAYKLMAKGNEEEPTVKLSDTRAKLSVPGPVQVLRGQSPSEPSTLMHYETPTSGTNAIVNFYNASKQGSEKFGNPCLETFATRQDRVVNGFRNMPLEQRVLSDEIHNIQDKVLADHGRSLNDFKF
jgi:nicotinamide phosphoribosyltransferase